jgi:hypothetical protein
MGMMPAGASLNDMANLKDLTHLADKLNAESDRFNLSLEVIEDRLNALGIGISVRLDAPSARMTETDWVDETNEGDGTPTGRRYFESTSLGYGRCGDQWGLLVHTLRQVETADGGLDIYEDEPPKPLRRASRELRIKAVEHLEALIDKIRYEASEAVERIEKAKKIAESLG